MNRTIIRNASLLTLAASLCACPPSDKDVMNNSGSDAGVHADAAIVAMDGTVVSQLDAALNTDADPPDSSIVCPSNPTVIEVHGNITANTTWDCTHTYLLADDAPIFVLSPAVLTIGPGTIIKGAEARSALVIARGARIEAEGTETQPIVFTSAQAVGSREQSDWGGLALLGSASINDGRTDPPVPGVNVLEGLMAGEADNGAYGGGTSPNDAHDCGTLRYVRIEFGGNELTPNNELNGLTLCACGSATTIDYVQVHRSADDGIEIFGGTVNIKHVIMTQSEDDGLDWDQGWRGKGQFIVVQGITVSSEADPTGIEADNDRNMNGATPIASPTLYNITIVGPGHTATMPRTMRAAVFRRGTGGHIYNAIFGEWPTSGIDMRDSATFGLANATTPGFSIENSILFNNGADGAQNFVDGETDADGFDESAWFLGRPNNRVGTDPMLAASSSVTAPNFIPASGSSAGSNAATPVSGDGFFDTTATYVGAFQPGATTSWTNGWTSFPEN